MLAGVWFVNVQVIAAVRGERKAGDCYEKSPLHSSSLQSGF